MLKNLRLDWGSGSGDHSGTLEVPRHGPKTVSSTGTSDVLLLSPKPFKMERLDIEILQSNLQNY